MPAIVSGSILARYWKLTSYTITCWFNDIENTQMLTWLINISKQKGKQPNGHMSSVYPFGIHSMIITPCILYWTYVIRKWTATGSKEVKMEKTHN